MSGEQQMFSYFIRCHDDASVVMVLLCRKPARQYAEISRTADYEFAEELART